MSIQFALVARILPHSSQVIAAVDKDMFPVNQRKHNKLWVVIIGHVL